MKVCVGEGEWVCGCKGESVSVGMGVCVSEEALEGQVPRELLGR